MAEKRFRQVLALDPDNEDATHGRSEIKEARERLKKDVAEGRRSRATTIEVPTEQYAIESATIARKLQSIILPLFEVRDMSLNDVMERLREDARKYDTDLNEEERGLNIFLKVRASPSPPTASSSTDSAAATQPSGSTKITLQLTNVSLLQALSQAADRAGLKVKVEPYAVSIVPLTEPVDELFTVELRIAPAFLGVEDEFTASPTGAMPGGSGPLAKRIDAKAFLEASGVTFPPGTSAVYLSSTSKLVIRNTRANLDLVQALWNEFKNSPHPATHP